MRYASFILIVAFLACVLSGHSQQPAADSTKTDSVQVAEISLLQLQEQHLLDSLIKITQALKRLPKTDVNF